MVYVIVVALLFAVELGYFRVAERFGIVDKPNERSSHSKVVLRGGGVIFAMGAVIWALAQFIIGQGGSLVASLPFLAGLLLVAVCSFVDDVRSLPDSLRLVVQFASMVLMFWSLDILHLELWWVVLIALVVCVGITNVYNFMDGINGITGGYSLAVLVPLLLVNGECSMDSSLTVVSICSCVVFCFFNFRPKNRARCFAGDVGSVSMAFILLFLLGRVIIQKSDVTYLLFLVVYGVDACFTILHRILLHENLGEAHRKHAYQLLANELGWSHIWVSLFYMVLQLCISLVLVFVIPPTAVARWVYLATVVVVLALAYVVFMRKYYHLHEEYLQSLR